MNQCILVDTDVMVDYLRGYDKAVALVKKLADRIALPAVVVAELYAGVKGDDEQAILDDLISLFPVVPITPEIARLGGLLKRDFAKSHGLGLADAIIAATSQLENAGLLTLNIKHYPMIAKLKPAYTK
ncbi:MAG: type II toxin-antitoxin system VapC family toxin [Phycisphaeraceae bacterium]